MTIPDPERRDVRIDDWELTFTGCFDGWLRHYCAGGPWLIPWKEERCPECDAEVPVTFYSLRHHYRL